MEYFKALNKNGHYMPACDEVTAEGFTLRTKCEEDTDGDTSWLGEFSNTKADKFSIEHEPGNHKTFNYFNAANVESNEEALQNYKRAAGYGERWGYYGLKVEAYKGDILLGSASLWGVDSDSNDSYLLWSFNELANEALEDAKVNLKNLIRGE